METTHLKGTPVHTYGNMPLIGEKAPHFCLTGKDLSPITLDRLKGKTVILNIFPSLDTATCAMTVRQFNKRAASYPNTVILAISADLPFAAQRFCTTENITHVQTASTFRSPEFGRQYGIEIIDGAMRGLLARAVFVIDQNQNIIYRELVNEITKEPNYNAALESLNIIQQV